MAIIMKSGIPYGADEARIQALETEIANKVDKVEGKGLSTNDYDDTEKAAVATIADKVDKVAGKGLSTNDFDNTAVSNLNKSVPHTTNITLSSGSWSNKTQSVSIADMTTTALVFSTPASASADKYAECGVKLSSQSAGSLTYTCETIPSTSLTVQVAYFLV